MTWDAYQLSFSFSHSIFRVWEMTHLIFTENYYTLRSFHTLCVCPGYGPLQSVPRPTLIILNHIAWDSWVMILSSFLQPLFSSLTWIIQITFFVHQPSLLGMTIVHSFLHSVTGYPEFTSLSTVDHLSHMLAVTCIKHHGISQQSTRGMQHGGQTQEKPYQNMNWVESNIHVNQNLYLILKANYQAGLPVSQLL